MSTAASSARRGGRRRAGGLSVDRVGHGPMVRSRRRRGSRSTSATNQRRGRCGGRRASGRAGRPPGRRQDGVERARPGGEHRRAVPADQLEDRDPDLAEVLDPPASRPASARSSRIAVGAAAARIGQVGVGPIRRHLGRRQADDPAHERGHEPVVVAGRARARRAPRGALRPGRLGRPGPGRLRRRRAAGGSGQERGAQPATSAERVANDIDRPAGCGRQLVDHRRDVLVLAIDRVGQPVAARAPAAAVDRDHPSGGGEPRGDGPERRVVGGRAVDEEECRPVGRSGPSPESPTRRSGSRRAIRRSRPGAACSITVCGCSRARRFRVEEPGGRRPPRQLAGQAVRAAGSRRGPSRIRATTSAFAAPPTIARIAGAAARIDGLNVTRGEVRLDVGGRRDRQGELVRA